MKGLVFLTAAWVTLAVPGMAFGQGSKPQTYSGYFDGGKAGLVASPNAAGTISLMLTFYGSEGCNYQLFGDMPPNATRVTIGSPKFVVTTLTRKGAGWSFITAPQYNPPHCAYQGELQPVTR